LGSCFDGAAAGAARRRPRWCRCRRPPTTADLAGKYRSLEAFAHFPKHPGQQIDLHRVGYLFMLSTPEDVSSFERDVTLQNQVGVTTRMIDVAEAARLSPLIETDGLLAAA
jgi:glycine/D-amino acid oxidase-like deaminating enzyme